MKTIYILIGFCFVQLFAFGQFAPDADSPGTTAIPYNDASFISWATGATIERGYLNIADKSFEINGSNKASFGVATNAIGIAEGNSADVVSLGDSGVVVLTFADAIINGPGFDFAVFENSFANDFLEFAFVEVSSNGVDFVRFPSYSNTQTDSQTDGFGFTDPTKVHNLAGKYRQGFGTPFDLEDLIDSTQLDLNQITHVKIIDVVGSISRTYGTSDSRDSLINDPFPTPFESGGFDLDAVGVIHNTVNSINEQDLEVGIYPNPATNYVNIESTYPIEKVEIIDIEGRVLESFQNKKQLDVSSIARGNYVLKIRSSKNTTMIRLILK